MKKITLLLLLVTFSLFTFARGGGGHGGGHSSSHASSHAVSHTTEHVTTHTESHGHIDGEAIAHTVGDLANIAISYRINSNGDTTYDQVNQTQQPTNTDADSNSDGWAIIWVMIIVFGIILLAVWGGDGLFEDFED